MYSPGEKGISQQIGMVFVVNEKAITFTVRAQVSVVFVCAGGLPAGYAQVVLNLIGSKKGTAALEDRALRCPSWRDQSTGSKKFHRKP